MKTVIRQCFFRLRVWVALIVFMPAFVFAQNSDLSTDNKQSDITYCIDPNWAPYEAIRNGAHIGISAQYLQIIAELSDLNFKLVPTDTWQQSLEYVQQGKCKVIPMLNTSDYRRQFLDFSLPYFEAPNVLVAKVGTPMLQGYGGVGNRSVGVVQGYRQVEYISRYYPSLRLRLVESEQSGLVQLANGEFDVMVGSLLSVNMHINNLRLKDLIVVGYAEPFDSLAFGVNKSHSELIEKLNYAIERIPESQKVDIFKQWNNVQVRYSQDYIKLFLSAAIVLMLLFAIIARKRYRVHFKRIIKQKNEEISALQSTLLEKNKTLAFLSSHDNVTGLYNRNHMIQRAEEEISRFHRFHTTASLIVIELTAINEDEFSFDSHAKEDALKIVASSCLNTVREVDVVSRFSDDQFIILCPQTPVGPAKTLADRLLEGMLGNLLLTSTFKIAVGMSQIHKDEEFSEWFERSVKALYQSKRLGFGKVSVAQ